MADEPRFDNPEDFARWLERRPAAWAQALAARAALRVLPLAAAGTAVRPDDDRSMLAVFRATLISWAAGKYPSHDMSAAAAAATTYAAADAADAATDAATAAATFAAAYAVNAADAATTTDAAAATTFAATYAAANAATAAGSATYAAATTYAAAANTAARSAAVWASVSRDADWLAANTAGRLIDQPLWLEDVREDARYRANLPPWARRALEGFADSEFASQHNFGPWIAWYRALLPNNRDVAPRNYFGESVTVKMATQPDDWWERPVAEVNADIAVWLEEKKPSEQLAAEVDGAEESDSGSTDEYSSQLQRTVDALQNLDRSLSSALAAGGSARHGEIGHNNSPEPLSPEEMYRQAQAEVRGTLELLNAPEVNKTWLVDLRATLGTFGDWLKKKADLAVNTAIVTGVPLLFADVSGAIEALTKLIGLLP